MITRYALRNAQGEWLRGPYWSAWTADINKAKLYANIGQARSRRTRIGGAIEIVMFQCEPVVVDETEYLAKAAKREVRKAARREKAFLLLKKQELDRAHRAFERAQSDLERARRG